MGFEIGVEFDGEAFKLAGDVGAGDARGEFFKGAAP